MYQKLIRHALVAPVVVWKAHVCVYVSVFVIDLNYTGKQRLKTDVKGCLKEWEHQVSSCDSHHNAVTAVKAIGPSGCCGCNNRRLRNLTQPIVTESGQYPWGDFFVTGLLVWLLVSTGHTKKLS